MASTQSTIRNAKISGIELMYKLKNHLQLSGARCGVADTYGKEATDSCTSTEVKWSLIIGRHRCTNDSKTLWSSNVPSIDGLS